MTSSLGSKLPSPFRSWKTLSCPFENVTFVIRTVQWLFGHPASAGVGVVGATVVTVNARLPFFMLVWSMSKPPDTSTGSAGFCPGDSLALPGALHTVFTIAAAFNRISTSKFPSPAIAPVHDNVSPLSTHDGPLLQWGLVAQAVVAVRQASKIRQIASIVKRRIVIPPVFDLFEVFREAFVKEKLSGWC